LSAVVHVECQHPLLQQDFEDSLYSCVPAKFLRDYIGIDLITPFPLPPPCPSCYSPLSHLTPRFRSLYLTVFVLYIYFSSTVRISLHSIRRSVCLYPYARPTYVSLLYYLRLHVLFAFFSSAKKNIMIFFSFFFLFFLLFFFFSSFFFFL
jgi:hypothetical protein